jgi:O-antigen ligase
VGTAILFFLCQLLGGGGAPAPVMQAVIETAALGWLLYIFWAHLFVRRLSRRAAGPGLFLLAIFLLAALQLLPLPYGLWTALPGREMAREAVQLAGAGEPWMPVSLLPEGTRLAILQLLPTLAVLFGAYALTPPQRLMLARIPIVVATISALVGAIQVSMPGTAGLYLFPRSNFAVASGLFANRNFQAGFLLSGILLAAWEIRTARGARPQAGAPLAPFALFAGLSIPLLAIMAVASLSRTGAALLVPTLLAAFLIASRGAPWRALLAGAGAVAALIAGLLLFQPPFVGEIMERFAENDSRLGPWDDMMQAAGAYFPLGSGLGTFDPVYRSVESLNAVGPTYLNHAHIDYVEILIEAGALGVAMVALFLVSLLLGAWRVYRGDAPSAYHKLQRVAVLSIGLIVLQSLVDYPLRTITIQTLFAFCCAILFSRAGDGPAARGLWSPRSPARFAAGAVFALAGAGMAFELVKVGLADAAVSRRVGSVAYGLRSQNSRAAALAAGDLLTAGRVEEAIRLARRAVLSSPIDPVAVRTLAQALNARSAGSGDRLMVHAAKMSWRDVPAQLWAIERGIYAGEPLIAVQRAEALVRLQREREIVFSLLRALATIPEGRRVMLDSLRRNPFWRRDFLSPSEPIAIEQIQPLIELLTELSRTEAPPTRVEARFAIDTLAQAKRHGEAWSLYARLFPADAREGLLRDGGFEREDTDYGTRVGAASVFDWRLTPEGDALAAVESGEGDGKRALFARSGGNLASAILNQTLVLAPGTYELSYRMRSENASAPQGLRWQLRCLLEGVNRFESSSAPLGSSGWETRRERFIVPPGCQAQLLALFSIPSTETNGFEAYLDDVAVRRAD